MYACISLMSPTVFLIISDLRTKFFLASWEGTVFMGFAGSMPVQVVQKNDFKCCNYFGFKKAVST